MPIFLDVDREQRLLRFRPVGDWDTEGMLRAFEEALASIRGEAGYDVLSDHREIGHPASPEQIQALLTLLARSPELHGRRGAVVVSKPASYGMIRLFAAHAEKLGMDVRVFSGLEEAMRFLRPPA